MNLLQKGYWSLLILCMMGSVPVFAAIPKQTQTAMAVTTQAQKRFKTDLQEQFVNPELTTADYFPDRQKATFQNMDFWTGGLNWSQWWGWAGNWGNIALNKIQAVPNAWRRAVLRNGLNAAFNGVSAGAITQYYRGNGLYCPDKPWWLWLPSGLQPAWPVLTCAESAR